MSYMMWSHHASHDVIWYNVASFASVGSTWAVGVAGLQGWHRLARGVELIRAGVAEGVSRGITWGTGARLSDCRRCAKSRAIRRGLWGIMDREASESGPPSPRAEECPKATDGLQPEKRYPFRVALLHNPTVTPSANTPGPQLGRRPNADDQIAFLLFRFRKPER